MFLFAHGTLIDSDCMKAHSKNARFVCPAKLKGWTRTDSLNIGRDEGRFVDGILWEITEEDLVLLDSYESCPEWYTREEVEVETLDGCVSALVYYIPA